MIVTPNGAIGDEELTQFVAKLVFTEPVASLGGAGPHAARH